MSLDRVASAFYQGKVKNIGTTKEMTRMTIRALATADCFNGISLLSRI
ncbi:hypothetical protein [Brevibacillus panacihumi]